MQNGQSQATEKDASAPAGGPQQTSTPAVVDVMKLRRNSSNKCKKLTRTPSSPPVNSPRKLTERGSPFKRPPVAMSPRSIQRAGSGKQIRKIRAVERRRRPRKHHLPPPPASHNLVAALSRTQNPNRALAALIETSHGAEM
ncbi:hypothetical protein GX50_08997 [[Emmonsia] crescens]|uniref:Uncharacterized protein n=1 Tax=[Emmonsia] crescens TaxID=73230 RepID=A0A2B7YBV8_9EURO|nr:hypothetical protein GX50_08997 [Emmonsia crescens]